MLDYLQDLKRFNANLHVSEFGPIDDLVELIRQGDNLKPNTGLVLILFSLSKSIISDEELVNDWRSWRIVSQVYDIEFHLVDIWKENAETQQLFFELTMTVLEKKFHGLYQSNEYYDRTIYFILMAVGWFTKREAEFEQITGKLDFVFDLIGRDNYLTQKWN